MPGSDEVVCLRCGFDLTAAQQIKTTTGEVEIEPEQPEEEPKFPLTQPGRGGLHLPAILAGSALLVLTIAFFVGARGLFPTGDGRFLNAEGEYASPTALWGSQYGRIVGLLRFYVLTGIFAASVYGGLWLISRIERRDIGDRNLALVRCLAIACACQMAQLMGEPIGEFLEWLIEFILMAGIFTGLSLVFFRLSSRELFWLGSTALLITGACVLLAGII